MKHISTYASLLALILVGVLYYLYFSHKDSHTGQRPVTGADMHSQFRIAYFDIDSLQNNYQYFKDVSGQLKKKEGEVSGQLNALQESYQKRIKELQARSATMTQSEGEAAQREYAQMQQKYQQRQMAMEQELKKNQIDLMADVRGKIENFLKEYNKQHGYAFILSYEPGFMLYYKDTAFDITGDVIAGLNDEYRKAQKP